MGKKLKDIELRDSPSGERNKQPILEHLQHYMPEDCSVLEIGSGTGQHAVFFTGQLAVKHWQMTEMPENMDLLKARKQQQGNGCLPEPLALDCSHADWHLPQQYDLVFSANTVHIMPWQAVCGLLHGVAKALKADGQFMLYGPFRYHGRDKAESNTKFHQHLRSRSPQMGLRDYYDLQAVAKLAGLTISEDLEMPANNRILISKHAK